MLNFWRRTRVGLRGGTESVAHIIALGLAAEIAAERMKEYADLAVLRDGMETRLLATTPGVRFLAVMRLDYLIRQSY